MSRPVSIALAGLLGLAFPALVYALIITSNRGDLFAPGYGWTAYNHYALALADGRFDIPLAAIGAEGFIVGGKVYLYYGLLPAIARWPLMPLIELNQTPVSLLMTWLFCALAAVMAQMALFRIYWLLARRSTSQALLLLAASVGVWLGSGAWLTVQSGSFYHEPFAAGLLLSAIALYLLVDDAILRQRPPSVARLCLYALLAGLAVFARQTMAISLYAVTLVLLAAPILATRPTRAAITAMLRRAVLPCAVLGGFGLAYLWTVDLRFGGDSFPMQNYGFYILYGSDPAYADQFRRLVEIDVVGQFHAARIPPNLIYYLFGGDALRAALIEQLGGGYTTSFHFPARLAASWAAPLIFAAIGLRSLVRGRSLVPILLAVAFAIGGVLQLSYATASYRYAVELWPVTALLMTLGFADLLRNPGLVQGARRAIPVLLLVTAVAMSGHNLSRSAMLRNDAPFAEGSLLQPMPTVLLQLVGERSVAQRPCERRLAAQRVGSSLHVSPSTGSPNSSCSSVEASRKPAAA